MILYVPGDTNGKVNGGVFSGLLSHLLHICNELPSNCFYVLVFTK